MDLGISITSIDASPLSDEEIAGELSECWESLPGGLIERQYQLSGQCGVIRIWWDDKIMFVAKATEIGRGLPKRLADFWRLSCSGRKHYGGRLIYAHRHLLSVEVLITGRDKRAGKVAEKLRDLFIRLHQPPWNVRGERAQR